LTHTFILTSRNENYNNTLKRPGLRSAEAVVVLIEIKRCNMLLERKLRSNKIEVEGAGFVGCALTSSRKLLFLASAAPWWRHTSHNQRCQ